MDTNFSSTHFGMDSLRIEINKVQGAAKLNNALLKAAESGNINFAQKLIARGADSAAVDEHGFTPLVCAARAGQTDMVKFLLPPDAPSVSILKGKNAASQRAGMAMILAVQHGHESVVEALTARGMNVNINERGIEDNTPLMIAACHGAFFIVEALIEAGAEIKAMNIHGESALHLAMMMGHEKIAFRLMLTMSQKAIDELEKDPLFSDFVPRFKQSIVEHQKFKLLKKLSEVSPDQDRVNVAFSLMKHMAVETINSLQNHPSLQDMIPCLNKMIEAYREKAHSRELVLRHNMRVDDKKEVSIRGTVQLTPNSAVIFRKVSNHIKTRHNTYSPNAEIVNQQRERGAFNHTRPRHHVSKASFGSGWRKSG